MVPLPPLLAAAPALAAPLNCALATVMAAARGLQIHLPETVRTRALVQVSPPRKTRSVLAGVGFLHIYSCKDHSFYP